MEEFNELIKKIGKELGIKVTLLADNWLTVLEKNNEIHYIQGYKFDLNNHGIGNIIDDKGLFFDLLRYKNIPIIEHKVIFSDYNKDDIIAYFHKNNNTLVVKGNIGTCGKEVFLVSDEESLLSSLNELFKSQFSISLCPFYKIKNEYRVIVLNGEARIIYGKERPKVIGDGKSTVKKLAVKFNEIYKDDDSLIKNPDYIPENGEEVVLNFQFNLSRGAKMFIDIPDDLKKKLTKQALLVTETLNITFASVDIINTVDDHLLVMEANSGVMMNNYIRLYGINGYNEAYSLYRDAIKMMFTKNIE